MSLLTVAVVGYTWMTNANEATAQSEDKDEAFKAAHAKLRELLDNTDDLFYKAQKNDQGVPFYTLVWEADGASSRFIVSLKELGFYQGKY
ncbi:MAG: hypothetical protein AAF961_20020, partial [Planctomycetota bacterium]